MVHPYKYSLINLTKAVRPKMKDYICWNFENEHGDLGFSNAEKSGIPLSRLGSQLRAQGDSNAAHLLANRIAEYADVNVAMARLRLDVIHGLNDLDLIETQAGIPPPDVIALLDLAFGATQHESISSRQRTLALKAMVIISQYPFLDGVSFETLSTILQLSNVEEDNPRPTVDEVALCTQGLLVFDSGSSKPLFAYNKSFHTYLREDKRPPAAKEMLAKLEEILKSSGKSWASYKEVEGFDSDPD